MTTTQPDERRLERTRRVYAAYWPHHDYGVDADEQLVDLIADLLHVALADDVNVEKVCADALIAARKERLVVPGDDNLGDEADRDGEALDEWLQITQRERMNRVSMMLPALTFDLDVARDTVDRLYLGVRTDAAARFGPDVRAAMTRVRAMIVDVQDRFADLRPWIEDGTAATS